MAVLIQFISVVVPISAIEEKQILGGFDCLLEAEGDAVGTFLWHDEHLLVEAAMNPNDVESIVSQWEARGLNGCLEIDGNQTWDELCVVDFYQGPTLPCDWLSFDPETHFAWHSNHPPGIKVSPEVFDANPLKIVNETIQIKPWWKFW